METLTQYWPQLLCAGGLGLAALAVRSGLRRRAERRQRDFDRTLGTVLKPRENVKVCCAGHGGRWAATSRRLLIETKEGFLAIPYQQIKSVQCRDAAGKTTRAPEKTASLIVKAAAEHTLRAQGPDFIALARLLKTKTTQKKGGKVKK